ncbi:hypothetical protein BDW66DRAFT_149753 [Aspergillus desertorum]
MPWPSNFSYCEDCDVTNVDLWVTESSYARKLGAGVDVNKSTSYEWVISLNGADVEASTQGTFRFLPADVSWGDNQEEISSAKFNLFPRSNSTSSLRTTSTAASTSTSTTGATSTSENATGSNSTSTNDSDGLSTGAKAGIGVGVGASAIILAALAFLLWRRIKALLNTKAVEPEGADGGYSQVHQVYFLDSPTVKATPQPVSARVASMSELAGITRGRWMPVLMLSSQLLSWMRLDFYSHHGR